MHFLDIGGGSLPSYGAEGRAGLFVAVRYGTFPRDFLRCGYFHRGGRCGVPCAFYTALAVLVIAVALGVVYLVRAGRKEGGSWMRYPARDVWLLLFLVLLVVQIWYGMGNQLYVSRYDTSYYNGNAINALYTDTMYQYDAYTGVYVGKAVAWHDSYSMLIAF